MADCIAGLKLNKEASRLHTVDVLVKVQTKVVKRVRHEEKQGRGIIYGE